MRSRARAVLCAMTVGTLLGGGLVLTALGMVGVNNPVPGMGSAGTATELIVSAIPGVLFLSLLFTAPSALILVWVMAGEMRQMPAFASPWLWGLAGAIVAFPTALLFMEAFSEDLFEVPSVRAAILLFGLFAGLAGRWGYREVGEPDRTEPNPPTTAA